MKVSFWGRLVAAIIFPFLLITWSILCLAAWLWGKITGRL